MQIKTTLVKAKELKPGDLFTKMGPTYWRHRDHSSIGEKLYVRTDAELPADELNTPTYRVTIKKEAPRVQ